MSKMWTLVPAALHCAGRPDRLAPPESDLGDTGLVQATQIQKWWTSFPGKTWTTSCAMPFFEFAACSGGHLRLHSYRSATMGSTLAARLAGM